MKKFWSWLLLLNLIPLTISGQNEYISTDSTITVGIKLVDGGEVINSRFCQVKENNEIIRYSPNEVEEYGFKDGRVYLSREIKLSDSIKRVFLERLSKGRINLYYYKSKGVKIYFLEKDSTLFIEFPEENISYTSYKEQLLGLTADCSNVKDAISYIRYNKKPLAEIINRYNNCEIKPFPHLRYGLIAGYELAKLIPADNNLNNHVKYLDFRYDGGFSAGLFIDSPISFSDLSVHAEFYFSRHGYSYYQLVDNIYIDFVANISSLKLPVLIRYSYPSNKYRPFINAGGIVKFNTRVENLLYETTILNNTIEINDRKNTSLIGKYQTGYSIGAGIESCLNPKRSLFIEVRYNKLYDNVGVLNESYINLMTGINF